MAHNSCSLREALKKVRTHIRSRTVSGQTAENYARRYPVFLLWLAYNAPRAWKTVSLVLNTQVRELSRSMSSVLAKYQSLVYPVCIYSCIARHLRTPSSVLHRMLSEEMDLIALKDSQHTSEQLNVLLHWLCSY
jgi:hypothetical protein